MSPANRPCPVTSGGSSIRGTGWPSTRRSSAARRRRIVLAHVALRLAHLRGGGAHRLDDVLVAGAAAEVGREHVEQLLVADVRLALEHVDREHQEARRAEAALQAVMIDEGLLQRMQRVAVGEPLDGADLPALRLHREHQAGAHGDVVEDDGAGAADAVLAADMGAGLPAVVADGVDQRAPRLDPDRIVAAVDGERDVDFLGHGRALRVLIRSSTRRASS